MAGVHEEASKVGEGGVDAIGTARLCILPNFHVIYFCFIKASLSLCLSQMVPKKVCKRCPHLQKLSLGKRTGPNFMSATRWRNLEWLGTSLPAVFASILVLSGVFLLCGKRHGEETS